MPVIQKRNSSEGFQIMVSNDMPNKYAYTNSRKTVEISKNAHDRRNNSVKTKSKIEKIPWRDLPIPYWSQKRCCFSAFSIFPFLTSADTSLAERKQKY